MLRPIVFLFIATSIHVSALVAQDATETEQSSEPNITQQSPEPGLGPDGTMAEPNATKPPEPSRPKRSPLRLDHAVFLPDLARAPGAVRAIRDRFLRNFFGWPNHCK